MNKCGFIVAAVLMVELGLGACRRTPVRPKENVASIGSSAVEEAPPKEPVAADTKSIPMAASLASFRANIYQPLLKPFCASCHEKTFGDPDVDKAHIAFLSRAGFDKFNGIEQTLPVLKMKQVHNCWDAAVKTCVTMMVDKMSLWLTDLEANGYKPTPITYPNVSSQVPFAASLTPAVVAIPAEYAAAGADKATLATPFTLSSNDSDGPIKTFATSPAATARLDAADPAQALTFTLDAKAVGTYFVWARVKTPTDDSNEFFIQANGGTPVELVLPVTGKDSWKWVEVMTTDDPAVPFSFDAAAAGPQTLKVLFREGGASINYLAITSKQDFNGELFSNTFFDVAVPLVVSGVDGVKLIATVWEFSKEEGKKALGVKSLRLSSPVPLHIKSIYPLINGIYHPNQGSYMLIDTIVGGPDPAKASITQAGSTASIWLADFAVDKLSFAFEVIEVAK